MLPKKYEEYEITTLNEFLNNLPEQSLEHPWGYRGQANKEWKLIPSLFREFLDSKDGIPTAWGFRNLEIMLLMKFKAYAMPYLTVVPNSDLAWLALAQHHGLPTRLLDWTENPLVALFFAVKDDVEHDAVVWAFITPYAVIEHEHTLEALDRELLMENNPKKDYSYLQEYKLDNTIHRYHPSHTSSRITAQQGFFTIQNFKEDIRTEPTEILSLEEQYGLDIYHMVVSGMDELWGPWFKKYVVPSQCKASLRKQLDVLGTNHFALFPDLEGIAKKLREDIRLKKRF